MSNGKSPLTAQARSLRSFGVSGLLAEDCKVYYDSLFSTRHLGRVSDLICARLRELGLDELRIRAILLFGFFDAYRTHINATGSSALLEPLVVECGLDSEKVALGVVFRTGIGLDTEGISTRVMSGKTNGVFEQLIMQLHEQADHLVVRSHLGEQIELVMLLAIKGQAKAKKVEPEVITMLAENEIGETPQAQQYVQLGDLDYASMLASDVPGKNANGQASGEYLSQGCTELEEAIRLRSRASSIEKKFNITDPLKAGESDRIRVQGKGADLSDTFLVKGKGGDLNDNTVTRVAGENGYFPEEEGQFGSVLFAAEEPAAAKTTVPERGPSSTEEASNNLMIEIEAGSLDRTLNKAELELKEIKKDVASAKVKRWMDALISDLTQEKARLGEFSKKLNANIKQKEHEFKTKEMQLQEELRRRDEMLKQKNHALNRTKDQLGLVNMTMEKLKAAQLEKGEDGSLKQKYAVSQKLLSSAKDESHKLLQRLEEAKAQVSSLQAKNKSAGSEVHAEFSAMKLKHDRAARQAEELRSMNEQLTARIQQLADRVEKPVAPSAVLEKRIEAAMKQVASSQKEADQYKSKVDELLREEQRLKIELKRAELEVRNLKTAAANRGGKPPKAA